VYSPVLVAATSLQKQFETNRKPASKSDYGPNHENLFAMATDG
jgi:hypothetical protein